MKNQLYVGKLLSRIIKRNPHYKCRMGRRNTHLKLTEDFLVIQQKEALKKLPLKKIGETSLHEKMWEIRVKVKCDHKVYLFDFPSIKKATDFYERIIFGKIKAHS
ncbi:MAG: hypothetical protein ACRCTE_13020 [Cellulosilyticaceae bacterium]